MIFFFDSLQRGINNQHKFNYFFKQNPHLIKTLIFSCYMFRISTNYKSSLVFTPYAIIIHLVIHEKIVQPKNLKAKKKKKINT